MADHAIVEDIKYKEILFYGQLLYIHWRVSSVLYIKTFPHQSIYYVQMMFSAEHDEKFQKHQIGIINKEMKNKQEIYV